MITNTVIGQRVYIARLFEKMALNQEALQAVPNRRSIQNRRNNLREQYKVFHTTSPVGGNYPYGGYNLDFFQSRRLFWVKLALETYTKIYFCSYIPPYKSKYHWTNPAKRTDWPQFMDDPEVNQHRKKLRDDNLKRSQEIDAVRERLSHEIPMCKEKEVILGIRDARVGERPVDIGYEFYQKLQHRNLG